MANLLTSTPLFHRTLQECPRAPFSTYWLLTGCGPFSFSFLGLYSTPELITKIFVKTWNNSRKSFERCRSSGFCFVFVFVCFFCCFLIIYLFNFISVWLCEDGAFSPWQFYLLEQAGFSELQTRRKAAAFGAPPPFRAPFQIPMLFYSTVM